MLKKAVSWYPAKVILGPFFINIVVIAHFHSYCEHFLLYDKSLNIPPIMCYVFSITLLVEGKYSETNTVQDYSYIELFCCVTYHNRSDFLFGRNTPLAVFVIFALVAITNKTNLVHAHRFSVSYQIDEQYHAHKQRHYC